MVFGLMLIKPPSVGALEESMKLILVTFVDNTKPWRVASHEKEASWWSCNRMCAGRDSKESCECLKTKRPVSGWVGGLGGGGGGRCLVAWELLQELGLLR